MTRIKQTISSRKYVLTTEEQLLNTINLTGPMSGRLSGRSSCSSRSNFIYPGGSGSNRASPKYLSFEKDSEDDELTRSDQIHDQTLVGTNESDDASETTLSSSGDERYLQTRLSDMEVQSTNRSEDVFAVDGAERRIIPRMTDSQIRRAILGTTGMNERVANTTGSGNSRREEMRRSTSEEHNSSPRALESGTFDEAPLVPEDELTEDQIRLRKALAKMRKLDKILIKKQKLAARVKRDRISLQRHVVSEVEMLEAVNDSDRTPSREEAVNTHKYLAMVRNDIKVKPDASATSSLLGGTGVGGFGGPDGNYEPLFATQPLIEHDQAVTKEDANISPKKSSSQKPTKKTSIRGKPTSKGSASTYTTTNNATSDSDRSASTIGGSSKSAKSGVSSSSSKQSNKITKHFIERNKELAADAASMIPMTPEERSRLDSLLENVDVMDENHDVNEFGEDFGFEEESSNGSFVGCAPLVGYGRRKIDGDKQKRRRYHAISAKEEKLLSEIDDRLSGYLSFEQFKQICWQDAPESDTRSPTSTSAVDKGDDKIRETREDRIRQIRLAHIDEKLRRLKVAGESQKDEKASNDGDSSLPAITDFQMRQLLNEIGAQHANDTAQGIMYPKPNKEELRTLLSREANLADEIRDWNYIEHDRSKSFSQELKELTKFADDIETFLAIEYNTDELSDVVNPGNSSSHIAKTEGAVASSIRANAKNYTVIDISREMEYLDKRADLLMQRLHNLPEIQDINVENVSSQEVVRSVTFEEIEQNERLYELDRDMESLRKKLASLEQLRKETLSNISVDISTNET